MKRCSDYAREQNVSQKPMRHIWKHNFGLKLLKFKKMESDLTDARCTKKVRLERSKELLRLAESGTIRFFLMSRRSTLAV